MAENDKKNPSDLNDLKARLGLKSSSGLGNEENQIGRSLEQDSPDRSSAVASSPKTSEPWGEKSSSSTGENFSNQRLYSRSDSSIDPISDKPLHARKSWLFLGIAATAVVFLVIGLVFGSIFDARSRYRVAVEQAKKFLEVLNDHKKNIDKIMVAYQDLDKKGEKSPPDLTALDVLKKIDWTKLNQEKEEMLTRLTKSELGSNNLTRLFRHYSLLQELRQQVENHVDETDKNMKHLEEYAKRMSQGNDSLAVKMAKKDEKEKVSELGLLMLTKDDPQARLVQIVSIQCKKPNEKDGKNGKESKDIVKPDGKSDAKDCLPTEKEVSFRMQPGGPVSATPSIFSTEEGGIIRVIPTELSKSLLVGDLERLAYQAFKIRQANITKTLQLIYDDEQWKTLYQWLDELSKK